MLKCLFFTLTLSFLVISAFALATARQTSDGRALNISTSRRDNEEDVRGWHPEDCPHVTGPTLNIFTKEQKKPLKFSERTGRNVRLSNNFRTARRINADEEFEGGVAITNRALDNGEMFEVLLEKFTPAWFSTMWIGVTQNSSDNFDFRQGCTMRICGVWIYIDFDELKVGDRIGVMKHENGTMDVFKNGELRTSYKNVPETVYGYVNLYGYAEQATMQLST